MTLKVCNVEHKDKKPLKIQCGSKTSVHNRFFLSAEYDSDLAQNEMIFSPLVRFYGYKKFQKD